MAIHHAASGEIVDIRPLGARLKDTSTRALYKSGTVEVLRMVLLAGKAMPSHRVAGEITVLCLEGGIEFRADGACQQMRQGDLLCLAGGQEHSLTAVQDSAILVTILLGGSGRG